MILSAAVGVLQVPAAHGKHGASAVAALQKAGVGVVVLLLSPVMGGGAGLPQCLGSGKGPVVNNGLVVMLNDNMLHLVPLPVLAVDFLAGVFPLPQRPDVKVVVDDALDGDDGPGPFGRALALLPPRLPPLPLGHAGSGDLLVSEVIGDLFVAPSVAIEPEDLPDDLRLGGDDLKFLTLIEDIAVGSGAEPLTVLLAALDDRFYLLGGVGDGHLVDEELELNFQPVVIVGKVDPVPNGDDTHPCVSQVFQLHQPPAVPSGEAGEILDDENVLLMGHQFPAHFLIAGPLVEGITRLVPVLIKGQDGAGKFLADKAFYDSLLVLDGGVIPVQLLVYGNPAVAGKVKGFNHRFHLLDFGR